MGIFFGIVLGLTVLGSAVTALPTLLMEWRHAESPEVLFYVGTRQPVVALTIDDGPSATTPEILEVLAEHDAHATFFVIGEHVRASPDLAGRIVAEGHELGHHMMADEPSIDLPEATFRTQFEEMDEILDGLGGSRVFRPGSGWYDDRMVDEAARFGYRTVLGSVYPFDAQVPYPSVAVWYMRQLIGPGSILVLHDGPERGARTVEVLETLLPELAARGIRVVPVSTLMEIEGTAEEARSTAHPPGRTGP